MSVYHMLPWARLEPTAIKMSVKLLGDDQSNLSITGSVVSP